LRAIEPRSRSACALSRAPSADSAHRAALSRPRPSRSAAQIIDVDEDGFATLLLEDGTTKDDLKLPLDSNDALCEEIKEKLAGDKDVSVTVLSAMGEDLIIACKEAADKPTVKGD
jgi:hypothetical protein